MKIKNNTKNLIPRKQIGGQIPKYKHAYERFRRSSPKQYTVPRQPKHNAYEVITDNNGKTISERRYYTKYPGVNAFKRFQLEYQDKLTNTKSDIRSGTQGSGTKGGTKGSGTRGNARTTAKPAATTFTESPTNITDQGWLDARNAAMQRGWGTYNYNGQTYRFTGDEFQQAKRNWNNRRKAGYQAEGILNLPSINVPDNLVFDNNYARKIESTVPQTKPVDTKTTPMTYLYQRGTLAKNPEITREALWQATQAVRNGDRDASYYGESSNLVSQLANANQDSAKNYVYNLWNTNNDVATQAGRKNYTESQGLTFGEPTTSNTNKDPLQLWATDFLKRSARQGAKLISRKQ